MQGWVELAGGPVGLGGAVGEKVGNVKRGLQGNHGGVDGFVVLPVRI